MPEDDVLSAHQIYPNSYAHTFTHTCQEPFVYQCLAWGHFDMSGIELPASPLRDKWLCPDSVFPRCEFFLEDECWISSLQVWFIIDWLTWCHSWIQFSHLKYSSLLTQMLALARFAPWLQVAFTVSLFAYRWVKRLPAEHRDQMFLFHDNLFS